MPGPASPCRLAAACGALVTLVGGLVLLGWWLGVTIVPTGVASVPMVKANAGMCLALVGIGLVLASAGRVVPVARFLGAVAVTIALLTLTESVLRTNIGFDQLLFSDPSALNPGRMPPNTAAGFAACGGALLLLGGRARRAVAECLGALGALIGWLSVVGFATGLSQMVQVGPFARMTLPSAICFLLLGGGILPRPRRAA